MDGAKLKPLQLATATGKTSGAVTHWIDGTAKSLKAETALAISQATGYSAEWIISGRGEKLTNGANLVAPMGLLSASGGPTVPAYAEQLEMLFRAIPIERRMDALNAVLPTLLGFLPVQTERTTPVPLPIDNPKKLDA